MATKGIKEKITTTHKLEVKGTLQNGQIETEEEGLKTFKELTKNFEGFTITDKVEQEVE